ncbi:FitA-like ribbon-helix-helix domain-containing protein [Arcanobacterium bovis]|uniref:Arc family DNA-binding protein n=1 Tax=Arcanobacterium bovis TaxID=2529275 RepID=A0A4Q9V1D0_9ACTO|nr:Arc family DNA-binding protein [Arcanobacterium bovis]TBW22896.1 Arc family DNA-binding protein [Arcanobacterium bovis]
MAEQLLIRDLPTGTKQALKTRARQNHTSMESEARKILSSVLCAERPSIASLLAQEITSSETDFDFDPPRLGIGSREVDL